MSTELQDAFSPSLSYHLSKLVTYPFDESAVTAGGAGDAQAIANMLGDFESKLKARGDNNSHILYDIESIKYALDELMSYYDREKPSEMNHHSAYVFGYFIKQRMTELENTAKELES